jgi:hypothetical protein
MNSASFWQSDIGSFTHTGIENFDNSFPIMSFNSFNIIEVEILKLFSPGS